MEEVLGLVAQGAWVVDGGFDLGGGKGTIRARLASCWIGKGIVPVRNSYIMIPNAHTSTSLLYCPPSSNSGDI